MNILTSIDNLVSYGLNNELFLELDIDYTRNSLLSFFKLDETTDFIYNTDIDIFKTMDCVYEYAYQINIIEENIIVFQDLLDAKIMDILMGKPSEISKKFYELYADSPKLATKYFYNLGKVTRYIRTDRLDNNICYKAKTNSGELDITINLSKPEKDPKEIALQKTMKSSNYPKCLLCKENVGYYGRINHPGRSNHRVIPLKLNNEDWCFQYSPYGYYNEHCIVLKAAHEPMKICKETFIRLSDFVSLFPHYFLGSNADLPIVGGSILAHDHFQGGNYPFAMANADTWYETKLNKFPNCDVTLANWPMSVIRISSIDKKELVDLADYILNKWIDYSDESVNLFAYTDQRHNTITPIARINNNGLFEFDLVLRNNLTTDEHPLGVYHPHADIHHIKKENIGLIEVMGLAVLPARLKSELELVKQVVLGAIEISKYPELQKHQQWIDSMNEKHKFTIDNVNEIIDLEVAYKFERCLIDAGVFKQDNTGKSAFIRFINSLN